eukprot:g19546.t1
MANDFTNRDRIFLRRFTMKNRQDSTPDVRLNSHPLVTSASLAHWQAYWITLPASPATKQPAKMSSCFFVRHKLYYMADFLASAKYTVVKVSFIMYATLDKFCQVVTNCVFLQFFWTNIDKTMSLDRKVEKCINKKKLPLAKVYWSFKIPTIPLELSLNIPVTPMSHVSVYNITLELHNDIWVRAPDQKDSSSIQKGSSSIPRTPLISPSSTSTQDVGEVMGESREGKGKSFAAPPLAEVEAGYQGGEYDKQGDIAWYFDDKKSKTPESIIAQSQSTSQLGTGTKTNPSDTCTIMMVESPEANSEGTFEPAHMMWDVVGRQWG